MAVTKQVFLIIAFCHLRQLSCPSSIVDDCAEIPATRGTKYNFYVILGCSGLQLDLWLSRSQFKKQRRSTNNRMFFHSHCNVSFIRSSFCSISCLIFSLLTEDVLSMPVIIVILTNPQILYSPQLSGGTKHSFHVFWTVLASSWIIVVEILVQEAAKVNE